MLLNKKFNNDIFILLIVAIFILFISISPINSVYAVEKTIGSSDNLKTTVENSLSESSVATINLKPGTYDMSGEAITINGNVTINGLATGSSRPILDAKNKNRIFVVNKGSTLTLKNLVITNGRCVAVGAGGINQGGGAIYSNGDLIIENCVFSKSTVSTQYYPSGGAIASEGGTLSIKSSTFTQNRAQKGDGSDSGGAIYCRGATLSIYGSTFTQNKASSGGAIDCLNTNTSIIKSYFNKNQAATGGAVDFSYISVIARSQNAIGNNELIISDSQFIENKATYLSKGYYYINGHQIKTTVDNGDGGAIKSSDSIVNINNCIFTKNIAGHSGGAINSYYDKISIKSSTFKENSASMGGAICARKLNIIKCTFTKNIAKIMHPYADLGGGAIYSTDGLNIVDSVFSKNKNNGKNGGGAIATAWGTVNIDKSTFTENIAKNGGAISFYKNNGTITRSIFNKNAASLNGSVIYCKKFDGITRDYTKGALIVSKNVFSGNKGKYILYRDKTFKKKLYANNNYWGKNKTLKKVKSSCYGINISKIATSPNIRK